MTAELAEVLSTRIVTVEYRVETEANTNEFEG